MGMRVWIGFGWAMVLGNFQCKGILQIWIITVGQGPTMLAVGVGVGEGCFGYCFQPLSFLKANHKIYVLKISKILSH